MLAASFYGLVTGLPVSDCYNGILVIVDRLTKMSHLIPCNETAGAQGVTRMYLKQVWNLHGLPTGIVSDRGPQFTTAFWLKLCQQLQIRPLLSTAFHPRTDDQHERAKKAGMQQYLRSYVSYQQENWLAFLSMAECVANNRVSETMGATLFMAYDGNHLHMNFATERKGTSATHAHPSYLVRCHHEQTRRPPLCRNAQCSRQTRTAG